MDYALKNFSIITAGGCNADCSFCTGKHEEAKSEDYLHNLDLAFTSLPVGWNQVSITGGEPTISPDFKDILDLVAKYKELGLINKCVLTTNGTKLRRWWPALIGIVDHINISRHAIGYEENVKIFKNKQIIKDKDLTELVNAGLLCGIDFTLNRVVTDDLPLTQQNMIEFIKYAGSLGCKTAFRFDQHKNSLEPHELEQELQRLGNKPFYESGCPVCKSSGYKLLGQEVQFKYSLVEPTDTIDELTNKKVTIDPYELIFHPSGKLTGDWSGQKEYCFNIFGVLIPAIKANDPANKKIMDSLKVKIKQLKSEIKVNNTGCGSSVSYGCGSYSTGSGSSFSCGSSQSYGCGRGSC